MISVYILFIVFILIAVRQIGTVRLKIWQIMLFGALAALLTGQISTAHAAKSINMDVILFLFGMFVIGQALEESGYLSYLSYKLFRRAKSVDYLILFILFGMGSASAFLMNDTLAIIGTPVVLILAKKHNIHTKVLLLALAFAVTIGSVTSPIGNPQNLLIAINGNIKNPFITFFGVLLAPTILSLFLCYLLLKLYYPEQFHKESISHLKDPIKDLNLAALSKTSLILIFILVFAKIATVFLDVNIEFGLTYIAPSAALPIFLFSRQRIGLIKRIDWPTLVFFASMFILMESVWQSGFFQSIMESGNLNIASIPIIFTLSVLLSQLISNVPLVALYLPMLAHAGAGSKEMIALAAGSTIAGNLTILGAASNVIIIENAEKRSNETLTFFDFTRIGVPLTIINLMVCWVFLSLV